LQISYYFFSKTVATVHLIIQKNVQKPQFPYKLLAVFGVCEVWRLSNTGFILFAAISYYFFWFDSFVSQTTTGMTCLSGYLTRQRHQKLKSKEI
jgi:hypothetical protein